MKKIIILVLALMLMLTVVAPAFAGGGASECGKGYGQLHKDFAQSGDTGSTHFPGWMHKGAAGICGVGIGS